MAFLQCLSLQPSSASCCCSSSSEASVLSSNRGALSPPSSSSSSAVCFLPLGGGDGLRSPSSSGTSLMKVSSSSRSSGRRRASFSVRAGIRAVETYDASFQLQPEADKTLRESLSSPTFCVQVGEQSMKGPDVMYEFTGELFQPVPWSPTTKFGMPAEFEKYIKDKENFTVINVPPNFMFKAKIFKPSRLCAVFKRV
ncbi:unnamed protein product [Calypogeia fissa]